MISKNYNFDGFTINLYLDEQGEWLANLREMPNISAFSETPEQAIDSLHTVWEMVKEDYQQKGRTLPIPPSYKDESKQFNVRIDQKIHQALALEALQAGIYLNALVSQKLAKYCPN